MSKKLYFLISFVLVLSLAGNVLAYETMIWDNDLGGGDRLWDTGTNWDWSSVGRPGRAPIATDWVCIDLYADDANGPIIYRGMDAVAEWVDMGGWDSPADLNEPAVLTMTGGSLTVSSWFEMGGYYPGTFRFDLSGGTIDAAGYSFYIGYMTGSYCTINMSGGTINSTDELRIGIEDTGQADFNMTGGIVNIDSWLTIGSYTELHGKGHVDLHGGTIEAYALSMGGGGEGTMDIANDGTLILDGDWRLPDGYLFDPCSDDPDNEGGHTGSIAILAKRGIITAYNTQVGDIITDGNYPSVVGLRAVINIDYDVPTADQTTITAGAVDPNLAWDPDPFDGTPDANSQAVALTLSWLPGLLAESNVDGHEVYFGTSWADVNDANTSTAVIYRGTGAGVVSGPDGNDRYSYAIPGGELPFVLGKSCFWRIDEVNSVNRWKGDVWSFDAEGKARIVYPTDGAVEIPFLNLTLRWEAGVDANSHDVYFGSDEAAVEDANINTAVVFQGNQPLADVNYALGDVDYGITFYWRIDEVNTGTFAKGHVWSFTTAPPRATNPSPKDGAGDVSPTVVLSWDKGPEAADVSGHHVYFSSDFDDVLDRDPSVRAVRGPNNYTPGLIEMDTWYYWAVDEFNAVETPNTWPGKVWDFKTDDHLHVDDFESYVGTADLHDIWHDYFTADSGTGQYNSFVEKEYDNVHEGLSAMSYKYDNESGAMFSEAWAYASELGAGTNWTVAVGGVKALRLYFYGHPDNTPDPVLDRMWVGLEDGDDPCGTGIVKYDTAHGYDLNDIKVAEWHEWNISLIDPCFSDVNLANVAKIYIGFGVKPAQDEEGTDGEVFFDDIQVWPPWCRPEKAAGDVTGDCIINYADVDLMAADWLLSDSNHTAASPAFAPQLWYTFDEGSGTTITNDGNLGATHNGIFTGDPNDPNWTTDAHPNDGNALSFDGVDDYIVIPGNLYSNTSNTVTITAWVKLSGRTPFTGIVFHRHLECAQQAGLNLGSAAEGGQPLTYTWANLSATYNWDSGLNMPLDQWTFVAVAVEAKLATVYMSDGVTLNFATNKLTHEAKEFSCTTLVGWDEAYADRHLKGLIDDVRIYDKTLTMSEMMYLAGVAGTIYVPVPSPANITDPEAQFSRKVNFRDYAILADHWLEGPTLWP